MTAIDNQPITAEQMIEYFKYSEYLEMGYRQGFYDAVKQLTYWLADEAVPGKQLDMYRHAVLKWMHGDCKKEVWPPCITSYTRE